MVSYSLLIVFIHSWLCSSICICIAANDSLKPGDTLNTTSQLCSQNGQYCLNFNPIYPKLPVNYTHLSITYTVNDGIAWVANRNQPVDKNSAILMLDHSGVLKIESPNIKPIILYSPPQPLNNTIATLLNSSNFVLQQLHPNGTKTLLWQSFDHPTDTLVPGMKLGVNHKTGQSWSLISWLAQGNPRFGALRLEWEPTRRELIIKKRGHVCWTSGELRNNNGSMYNTKYMIVSNEDESYFAITTSTSWTILETGQISIGDVKVIAGADMCYGYNTNGGKKKWIWIIIVTVAALFVICAIILFLALKRRKHLTNATCNTDLEEEFKKRQDLKVLSYATVLLATNNFSPEQKLGQGGFGPVYKAILPTGQEAAIKRLSKTSKQGIVEFKNELLLICELQHMNLVRLLGCCIHQEERILIYEYMPNKSLDFYLFDCTKSKLLDWKKRFNIIEGISQGLLYLHKYSRLKVIHRDLKTSNILLDGNMNPKISDFGLARMFEEQESTRSTSRIIGTYGYMSPEYAMEGIFSIKSDVYSFGVLILEIVSGKRNTSFYDDRSINLIGYAWELWNEGVPLKLMDPSLDDLFDLEEAKRCIHIGLLCVEQEADDRPTMSHIIAMLTNESAVATLPQRPAFYGGKDNFEWKTFSKELYISSTKETNTSL